MKCRDAKAWAGHVLYIQCAKSSKSFSSDYFSAIKMGGEDHRLHVNEVTFVKELWDFRRKLFGRRLHQSSLIVRITLHS